MELPLTGKVVLMPLICTEELAIVLATDERAGVAMRAGVSTTGNITSVANACQ